MEKYSNKCYKSVTLFVFLNIYNNCRLKGARYIHNWNMFKNQNDDIVCALIWTSAGDYLNILWSKLHISRETLHSLIKHSFITHEKKRPRILVSKFISYFFYFFYAFDFCRSPVVIRFYHSRHNGQWPPTLDSKLYPLHSFSYLNSSERASISLLMLSAKQENYKYHFYYVFGMTRSLSGDWTGDRPHSMLVLYH